MAGTRKANRAGVSLSSEQDSCSFFRSSTTGNAGAYLETPRSETTRMTHYKPYPNTSCTRNMVQLSQSSACAAAILAAITSGPGTYSVAGTPTVLIVVESSDRLISDHNERLSDQMPTSAPAVRVDDHSQAVVGHLDSTVRTSNRSRCQPTLLDKKIPSVLGNGDVGGNNVAAQLSSVYRSVCDSTQSDQSQLHDDVEVEQDNRSASMAVHTPITADMTTGHTSLVGVGGGIGAVYDYRAVGACDPYRTRKHVTPHNHHSPHLGGFSLRRRLDHLTCLQLSPPKVGTFESLYALGSSTPSSTTTAATTTATWHLMSKDPFLYILQFLPIYLHTVLRANGS
ncbi:hypothetical protein FGIG_00138 [Fasciola gigantica]|uniref:Uncharacterized protein n=1 Tax=Fasciola gigantica TaxID=46835 RepID=A0A504Z387_FASGI|nr:hypothetical protein FGIG_00138 [Fasciola gigantica]